MNIMDDLEVKTCLGLRAYYKGTSLHAPVPSNREEEFHKCIITTGEDLIASELREGKTLSEIKANIKGQMDLMEDGLRRTFPMVLGKGDEFEWMAKATNGTRLGRNDSLRNIIRWFMNIAALLKLKVIDNDNNNGWSIMRLAE